MFDNLSDKFYDAFKSIRGTGKISEENIEETLKKVRTALLEADVNFKVVKTFIAAVKEKALGQKVLRGVNPGEQFVSIMHDELAAIMGHKEGQETEEINFNRPPVMPILIVGLNGSGKTTFAGKLSYWLTKKQKKDVLLVPADTFRPAAKDQLVTLAKSMGVDYFDSDLSMHPKEIAKKAMDYANDLHKEIVIIDTAGRLHVDEELMEQLAEIKAVLKTPEVLLVADSMTGQEAVNVAESFHRRIGLTGAVLSKMDSDARGGAALSIRYVTQVPIRFISLGEKMKDIEIFHPDRLAKRILDMGDVLTLVERAQEVVDEKEAEKMMKNMEKNRFTISDFMKQMNTISKLGSFESIMKMIPGMSGMARQLGDLSPAEGEMTKMKIIIQSMTKKEREDDSLFNNSRIARIAKGSGTTPAQVNDFLNKFRQMKKMMAGMMGMMKGGGMPNIPGMPMQKGFRQQSKGQQNPKVKANSKFGKRYF